MGSERVWALGSMQFRFSDQGATSGSVPRSGEETGQWEKELVFTLIGSDPRGRDFIPEGSKDPSEA